MKVTTLTHFTLVLLAAGAQLSKSFETANDLLDLVALLAQRLLVRPEIVEILIGRRDWEEAKLHGQCACFVALSKPDP